MCDDRIFFCIFISVRIEKILAKFKGKKHTHEQHTDEKRAFFLFEWAKNGSNWFFMWIIKVAHFIADMCLILLMPVGLLMHSTGTQTWLNSW